MWMKSNELILNTNTTNYIMFGTKTKISMELNLFYSNKNYSGVKYNMFMSNCR